MNNKKMKLVVGILYLSLVVLGPIGFMVLPEQFNVVNVNEFASENLGLIGAWIFVDILIITVEVFISVYLYRILREHNEKFALATSATRFAVVAIMVVNTVFLLITLFSGGSNADTFIEYHNSGVFVWQLPFSVHVVLLGIMAMKYTRSKWKYLGIALILGGLGYLLDSIQHLGNIESSVFGTISMVLLVFVMIGEIGIAIGLLLNKVWE